MAEQIIPTEITLHKQSKSLGLSYGDQHYDLPAEFLRVYSPSAEVQGHGPGQETLQLNKQDVAINHIEPVGQYAIKITYDDGHDSGLYTWDYLYKLSTQQPALWQDYLDRLAKAGHSRPS